ncbi:MAG: hypothetical protein HFACDABA_02287 [Anaerolineales bacterium]|nr:hypothetical protein [Anaerolineales bacterium]
MNHLPFETWLLNEQPLAPEQQRGLQQHLRACDHCAALAEVNLALRAAKLAAPAPGFTARFQQRLEMQRALERRNRLVGMSALALGALGLTLWLAGPWLASFFGSPAAWIAAMANFLLSLLAMGQAIGDISSILLRILPGLIPPIAWLVTLSAVSGLGLLWAASIWRLTRLPERSVRL